MILLKLSLKQLSYAMRLCLGLFVMCVGIGVISCCCALCGHAHKRALRVSLSSDDPIRLDQSVIIIDDLVLDFSNLKPPFFLLKSYKKVSEGIHITVHHNNMYVIYFM